MEAKKTTIATTTYECMHAPVEVVIDVSREVAVRRVTRNPKLDVGEHAVVVRVSLFQHVLRQRQVFLRE